MSGLLVQWDKKILLSFNENWRRKKGTQGPRGPRALCTLFLPDKYPGPYCFSVTATLKKASCFWNQSNKMWAKFLGGEIIGTAASYMSCSSSLPQIVSTEFSMGHHMIILADNDNLLPYSATKSTLVTYHPLTLKGADALLLLWDLLRLCFRSLSW